MSAPPYPSPTALWYNTTYPSISPLNPSLSVSNKTILITGGGSGIGRATALAFAEAGAAKIHLFGGRRENVLLDAKKEIELKFKNVLVEISAFDIVDEEAVAKASEDVENWDVLVLNSGAMFGAEQIGGPKAEGWWRTFEVNVKGNFNIVHSLLSKRDTNAALLGCSAGTISVPPAYFLGHSAYTSSKIAMVKFLEFVAAETPDLFVASYHPGVVETDLFAAGGAVKSMALDTAELPAHFTVWLASPEARFLRGRFVWCNWDVEELKAKAGEIEADPFLYTTNIIGWPFVKTGEGEKDK